MNSQSDKPIQYLKSADLYNINFTVTGGDTFVRDIHLLESAAKRPALVVFGEEQFPTLLDKAAALMESIAYRHLFADGNKRTAIIAVEIFLSRNDCEPVWTDAEIEAFTLEVAQHQHDVPAIAAWLRERVQCGG